MSKAKRRAYSSGLAVLLVPLTAAANGDVEEEDPLVYGGTDVAPCGWPTTVFLGGCTGTLVHPQVVIYAAHCGANINSVRFGENGNTPSKSVGTKYCKTNPAGPALGSGRDHAFCVLNEAVDAPIVPPLMGCETNILQPGQEVTIVGFGNADTGPFGIKREVTTTINGISNDEAHIGGGGKDSCQGDSGGPVYVKLTSDKNGDDTWRVFGITSYGGACGGGGSYSMMHIGMPWIEGELAAEQIDLTPCFDSDGNWQPTMGCFGFPRDPSPGYGSWTNYCDPGPVGAYSGICGEPFNNVPDETPPIVTITAPTQQQTFDTMGAGSVPVQIDVTADDGEGWGVQSVQLLIDGNAVPNGELFQPPYAWGPNFPAGQFELGAIAVDYADNVGMAEPIFIGVDMEAEEPPPPMDDDGAEDGTGSGGGDDAGQGDDEGSDKGCGCSATPSGGSWGMLGMLGLAAFRRRR